MSATELTERAPAGGSLLTLEQHTKDGLWTLTVTGDLDMTTYDGFCRALSDEADRTTPAVSMCLDLTGVDYMDARTWLLIVQTQRRLLRQGRSLSVALESRRQPERVYQMLALDRVVPRSEKAASLPPASHAF